MSRPAEPEQAAVVFAALGDPTRLRLLRRLGDGDSRSISDLGDEADMTRQAVTKHLRVLEAVGLVSNIRVGRESRFRAEPEALAPALTYLEQVSTAWDQALRRLRAHVEQGA